MSYKLKHSFLLLYILWTIVRGSPVPETEKSVFDLILELSKNCVDNPLLHESSHLELGYCKESRKLETTAALNCVSFLDINRRLCELNNFAQFNWTERIRVEQQKTINLETICNQNNSINFGSVPEFPKYKEMIQKAFSKKETCFRLCISDDSSVFDESANYFCKILSYGSEIIKNVQSEVEKANDQSKVLSNSTSVNPEVAEAARLNDASTKHSIQEGSVKTQIFLPKNENTEAKIEQTKKPEYVINNSTANSILNSPALSTESKLSKTDETSTKIREQSNPNDLKVTEKLPQNDNPIAKEVPKLHLKSPDHDIKQNFPVTISSLAEKADEIPDNFMPVPADKPDLGPDDEYDNVLGGDDRQMDTNIEDGGDTEEFVAKKKMETTRIDTIPRELITFNTDGYSEEDGSFFPMFFFGIGAMVMLYILYHNKNKIMGLLIEGRQPGSRRRMSRGHSYKRLDTLEQAISSNAPGSTPSKIIY